MKRVLISAVAALVLLLTGCNTISGMGEDIGAAGGAIKEAATKTKEKL